MSVLMFNKCRPCQSDKPRAAQVGAPLIRVPGNALVPAVPAPPPPALGLEDAWALIRDK